MAESVRTPILAERVPGPRSVSRGRRGGMMEDAMHRRRATSVRRAPAWCVRARLLALTGSLLLLAGCEPMVGGDDGGSEDAPAAQSPDEPELPDEPAPEPPEEPDPGDPLYSDQWHLENTAQTSPDGAEAAAVGMDLGVVEAWGAGYRGAGVTIAVLDDALALDHEDLAANSRVGLSNDYTDPGSTDPSPTPGSNRFHGTAVGGIAAARDGNGHGGRGVAPRADLAGFNILATNEGADITAALERDVAVSNNSWGPEDGTGELRELGVEGWRASVRGGTEANRNGRGTVYIWAAGNGFGGCAGEDCAPRDDSNYDAAANYWRVLAVSAVNALGRPSIYSERGANVLVSGPGGRFCTDSALAVTTTFPEAVDRPANWASDYTGRPAYTRCFNGTSAAAPGVAGVAALILEANPDLAWREVRWILATTARDADIPPDADSNPLNEPDGWQENGAGHRVSHAYGHGLVDAGAAVAEAVSWAQQGRSLDPLREANVADAAFPVIAAGSTEGPVGRSATAEVTESGIDTIEAVEVTLEGWSHPAWNRLDIELVHTDGEGRVLSRSVLAEEHDCGTTQPSLSGCSGLEGRTWTFSTTQHLGESANGDWRLEITNNSAEAGTLDSWTLTFHGH